MHSRRGRARQAAAMDSPFLGTEALRTGAVRKHELRSRFHAIYPGVYVCRATTPSFRDRAEAAWLWSHREGVLAGLTASRLYGAKWIDDSTPIEVNWSNGRPPAGVQVFRDRLEPGECWTRAGLPVTTVPRTAFDIGRRGSLSAAVARLDALGNATGVTGNDVVEVAEAHRGARGLRQLRAALTLYDAGAESPRETWLRLLIVGAGFPRPQTQVPVLVHARAKYYLDLAWEDLMLAIEYDGDHHRTDRVQFARDISRLEELADLGWMVLRVAADTAPHEVLAKLHRAWASKVR